MWMYNLLENSQNYSMTLESLWNCCKVEIDDALDGKSFNYRTKIVGKPPQRPTNTTTTTTSISFKY